MMKRESGNPLVSSPIRKDLPKPVEQTTVPWSCFSMASSTSPLTGAQFGNSIPLERLKESGSIPFVGKRKGDPFLIKNSVIVSSKPEGNNRFHHPDGKGTCFSAPLGSSKGT